MIYKKGIPQELKTSHAVTLEASPIPRAKEVVRRLMRDSHHLATPDYIEFSPLPVTVTRLLRKEVLQKSTS
jgi:hypothetical protein